MSIKQSFVAAVESGNKIKIRVFLKDLMLIDPSFRTFSEHFNFAKERFPSLCDTDDGAVFSEDQKSWTKQELDLQMVMLISSFTERRISHLKKMCAYLYADKIRQNLQSPQPSSSADTSRASWKSNSWEAKSGTSTSIKLSPASAGITLGGAIATTAGFIYEINSLKALGVMALVTGACLLFNNKD